MAEYKLFTTEEAFVSTAAFHEHRERAPHWEQGTHRPRLEVAASMVNAAVSSWLWWRDDDRPARVIDLGCGDGGLLMYLTHSFPGIMDCHGYDFQPSNAAGWVERAVNAEALNFVNEWGRVPNAEVYIATEVLEHLTDPHKMVKQIAMRGAQLVCSSPWTEHKDSHDACHAWAWDLDGYREMLEKAGFIVRRHEKVGMFQVVLAVPSDRR